MEKNLKQIKISGLFDPLITGISGISFVAKNSSQAMRRRSIITLILLRVETTGSS